jgi:hypothetical protein
MDELNIDKINEAFQNNAELKEQFIESFKGSESGQSLLNNHAENHWNDKIGTTIGELHQKYDNDFEEAFGRKRPDGVKTYSFFKEETERLKQLANASDPSVLAEKDRIISELNTKLENGSANDHFKSLYDSLQIDTETRIKELTGQIDGFKEKSRLGQIESTLTKALSGLTFNEGLPKDLVDGHVNNLIASLTSSAKVMEDGTVTFYDGDIPIRDKNLANMKAEQLLRTRLESVLAKKDATGGGVDPNKRDLNNPNPLMTSASISSAKTQSQLMTAIESDLISKGLSKRSIEYRKQMDELFAQHMKGLPIK